MRTMTHGFTRTDYGRLPEGFPAQLIDGLLAKDPAPTYGHGRLAARIRAALLPHVGPDLLPDAPSDVAVDDRNVFQPDIVVLREPVPDDEHYVGVPAIAVEVLSPSTREVDRTVKARRLLEIGVEEVWLVDAAAQTIEVCTRAGRRVARDGQAAVSAAVAGFQLVPSRLFTPPRSG